MSFLEYRYQKAEMTSEHSIFLLHGYGSSEDDLFGFARYLPSNHHVFSLRAPYSTGMNGFAWYAISFDSDGTKWNDTTQALDSVNLIFNEIHRLRKQYQLSGTISLIGFSQGAILSLALAHHYPDGFSKIVALSGYLNEELSPDNQKKQSSAQFFMSHGTEDQVIPLEWASYSAKRMTENGLDIQFKTYPTGHQIHPDNFKDLLAFIHQ